MRRLDLDYAHVNPLPRWLGISLLLAGLGTAALTGAHYRTLATETARWEASAAALEKGSQRAPAARAGAELQQAFEIRHANEVVSRLNVPWDALFLAVEAANSDKVALLSIEPDAQKQEVKISGEAKSLGAMLDYVRRLGLQTMFAGVHLQNHQVQQQDPEKPIRFMVLATWRS